MSLACTLALQLENIQGAWMGPQRDLVGDWGRHTEHLLVHLLPLV